MDPNEFIEAFDTYHKEIYRYIFYKTKMRKALAEDLTQEVFFKVWENRKRYKKETASIRTWLFKIARNLVIDNYRKKNTETLDSEYGNEAKDKTNVYERILAKKTVEDSLKLLNERERELIVLRYIQEFEIEEIAKIINKNYESTKVSIHRSLQKLKLIL